MSSQRIEHIAILGAGAFGTALALLFSMYFKISLFSYFDDHVQRMKKDRKNEFFENFQIPENIEIETVANFNSKRFDCAFWTFPIKPTVEILSSISERLNGKKVVVCSKGLNFDGSFLFDAFKKILPASKIAYLSGPNFASELAERKFSAADIATENMADSIEFAEELSIPDLRLNPIDDIVGIQLCGAMKNIIAIACGIASGLGFKFNTQAALLTAGLNEMKSLGHSLQAKEETFYGLCGIGDLILTASSDTSRNRTLGKRIANGEKANIICDTKRSACEGYDTLLQIIQLAQKFHVHLPICRAVFEILFNEKDPATVIDAIR